MNDCVDADRLQVVGLPGSWDKDFQGEQGKIGYYIACRVCCPPGLVAAADMRKLVERKDLGEFWREQATIDGMEGLQCALLRTNHDNVPDFGLT